MCGGLGRQGLGLECLVFAPKDCFFKGHKLENTLYRNRPIQNKQPAPSPVRLPSVTPRGEHSPPQSVGGAELPPRVVVLAGASLHWHQWRLSSGVPLLCSLAGRGCLSELVSWLWAGQEVSALHGLSLTKLPYLWLVKLLPLWLVRSLFVQRKLREQRLWSQPRVSLAARGPSGPVEVSPSSREL